MLHHTFPRLKSRRSFLATSLGAGIAAIGVAIPARCAGKIYPGTLINSIEVGGLGTQPAIALLQESLSSWEQGAITLQSGDRRWHASLADLGYTIDYTTTVEHALDSGRDAGLFGRYTSWLEQNDVRRIPLTYQRDTARLNAYLAGIAAELAIDPVDARLGVGDTGEIVIAEARPGRQLNVQRARLDIAATIDSAQLGTVLLTTVDVQPGITAIDLEPVKATATSLIGQPVTIIAGDQHWAVSEHQLAAALCLPEDTVNGIPTIDPDALLPDLTQIQEELGQSPKDAVVGWDNGLYVLEDGTDGVEVDLASLSEAIAAAATTEQRTVEVSLLPIKPTVHRGNLDTLGITTRLGTGSSSFAGSDDARAENLRVGAFWVDQTLIPPRSSFSFNEALGPISLDRGYVEGKIIADNWYESDIGGGVCQVSTTVFRAALYAGLEFQEWHPHSFRLGFYELEDWPPGMDAAIYVPNTPDETELDLVFANPTDSWLLLQLGINGDRLTAEIIGPNTGYDVEIAAPQVSDPIAPPAPEERVDPELAAGDRVMAQTEKPGYEVTMRRVVMLGADTIADNTFYSYYFPQPEVWQVSPANA